MLFEMLPVLEGWSYQYMRKTGKIKVGERQKLLDETSGRGYILYAAAGMSGSLDAKYFRFDIEVDGPGRAFAIVGDYAFLKKYGYLTPIPYGIVLTKFSDEEKAYNAVTTFSKPTPFTRRIRAFITPPSEPVEETTVTEIDYSVTIGLVRIEDIDTFIKSVRYVLGPEFKEQVRELLR